MLHGNRKHGPQQGEWNTDIVRVEGAIRSVRRKGRRPCPKETCKSDGYCNGGLIRDIERALRSPKGQGQDGAG